MRRIVLITGATNGLGLEMASALANGQYELILTCRNLNKGAEILRQLSEADPDAKIRMLELDLASFKSIESFAAQVILVYSRIDVLFNNAGVYMDKACRTAEGFEMTVGVNYIGPYYLIRKLLPLLRQGKQPQIIQMCSRAAFYGSYRDRDKVFEKRCHGFRAYAASKLMQLLMTLYLAEELKPSGITVNALHPGVVPTGIFRGESLLMRFLAKTSKKHYAVARNAARSGLFLIENEAMRTETGKFFEGQGQEIKLRRKFRNKQRSASLIRRTNAAIRKRVGPLGI